MYIFQFYLVDLRREGCARALQQPRQKNKGLTVLSEADQSINSCTTRRARRMINNTLSPNDRFSKPERKSRFD
jgi:hypothetical protein